MDATSSAAKSYVIIPKRMLHWRDYQPTRATSLEQSFVTWPTCSWHTRVVCLMSAFRVVDRIRAMPPPPNLLESIVSALHQ